MAFCFVPLVFAVGFGFWLFVALLLIIVLIIVLCFVIIWINIAQVKEMGNSFANTFPVQNNSQEGFPRKYFVQEFLRKLESDR